ncbi:MAG: hypothetical protein AAF442_02760 [Pseudomonadota bacterium]
MKNGLFSIRRFYLGYVCIGVFFYLCLVFSAATAQPITPSAIDVKGWRGGALRTDHGGLFHGCAVTRQSAPGQDRLQTPLPTLVIEYDPTGRVSLIITTPDFFYEPPALLAAADLIIDDGDLQTRPGWVMDDHTLAIDISDAQALEPFRRGRTAAVMLHTHIIPIDLTGTFAALDHLRACARTGTATLPRAGVIPAQEIRDFLYNSGQGVTLLESYDGWAPGGFTLTHRFATDLPGKGQVLQSTRPPDTDPDHVITMAGRIVTQLCPGAKAPLSWQDRTRRDRYAAAYGVMTCAKEVIRANIGAIIFLDGDYITVFILENSGSTQELQAASARLYEILRDHLLTVPLPRS